jgi:excisionase family DNA binding protein
MFVVTILKSTVMVTTNDIKRPNKQERKLAQESYNSLISSIEQLKSDQVEIEIEESGEKIILPLKALNLLGEILKAMSQGKPISIVPIATEVTTQRAAEILGCSRPYLVKLLEEGKIEYTKVGKHRRIKYEDVIDYKKKMKEEQKKRLIEIMHADEDLGLYDS